MRGEPTSFWGKINRSPSGVCEWHPLFDHCADVAAVTEALLGLPVWRRRFERIAGRDLHASGWARLAALAALHDIGKLNLGFQAKGRPELGATAGHVSEALAALDKPVLKDLGSLNEWGDGVFFLLASAICHHGRPYSVDGVGASWQAAWWRPRGGLDPSAGCTELLRRCRSWFPEAFDPGATLPDVQALTHAFAGLVMLADWLGSDTRFFPFSDDLGDRMPFARRQAREAIAGVGLDLPTSARSAPGHRDPFRRVAPPGYSIRAAQAALIGLPLPTPEAPGTVTIVEAETGSGKTEAALARFVQLFEAGLVDGLYFALPTRSAATQIHGRVLAAARQAFSAPPPVVLAVPGYLRVDDVEGSRLPPFEVLWPADDERFRYRAWAAENTKRYLAGSIVVGTIDQVLLSALMVGHAHLRAAALLRHLLVVDEVHASDAYMGWVLQDVLTRHLSAGGHALLLSATLGSEARARLVQPGLPAAAPSLGQAVAAPYPLITHASDGATRIPVPSDGPSRTIQVKTEPWISEPRLVAQGALAAALRGAKVLVIRNTVADCVATQEELEREAHAQGRPDILFTCANVPAPHHARFARVDRTALDNALEQHFGKDRRPGGCVVVATQTVQQSLDIDADVLFTDLCPTDVLLQRLGRLHRHARQRPQGFELARALVAVPQDRRKLGRLISDKGNAGSYHGLGSVYPDLRILEATWRLLEKHSEWQTPAMNRLLVEHSLHSEVLARLVGELGDRWRSHEVQMIGTRRGQERLADLNLVDRARFYPEMNFPSSSDRRIPTRLGEGDRLVHFPEPPTGPFGETFTELAIPAWQSRGIDPQAETAEAVSIVQGHLKFQLGDRPFVYDRLGLRPDAAQQEAADDDGP